MERDGTGWDGMGWEVMVYLTKDLRIRHRSTTSGCWMLDARSWNY